MSTYYLVNKKTKGVFPLGETSFKTFYPEDAWYFFNKFIENENIDTLSNYIIRKDNGEIIDILEFLDDISTYKIMD